VSADLITRVKRLATGLGVLALFLLVLLVSAWNMVFHYVKPGEVLVVISKMGTDLPAGELLAKPGQKGPLTDVLGEGRHFIWPVLYEVEKHRLKDLNMEVPPLKVAVVRSKVGKPLPEGRILAEPGKERGIWNKVLPPGRHRLNPRAYEVELADAIVIRPGSVGFVMRMVGNEPTAAGAFADPAKDEKGILNTVLQPGIYYLNPYEYRVREVEVGLNQVSFLGADQISFPSKDAFDIRLEATVEWELEPKNVARVINEFGARREIEDKVLVPQSRSIGRLEGSSYGAKDFLLGDGRELIQQAFTQRLKEEVQKKHVLVHSAYIRHITIPDNLLVPIRQSFVAQEVERTAKIQEATRKSAALLEREQRLIQQRREEVKAETAALAQKIQADSGRLVAEIEADTRRLVAEKQQAIAVLEAERTELLGKARAQVAELLGEARAGLFALKVQAFNGDSRAFARYAFAEALPEDLQIRLVQTGEGTFWTDLGTASGQGPLMGKVVEEAQQRQRATGAQPKAPAR